VPPPAPLPALSEACPTVWSSFQCKTLTQALRLLVAIDTARRRSRGKQPQSYRFGDEYSFLDEDTTSAPSGAQTPNHNERELEDDEEADDFMPDAEEEPEDDFDEEPVESSDFDEAGSDEEDSENDGAEMQKLSIVEVKSKHDLGHSQPQRAQNPEHTPRSKVKVPIQITRGGGTAPRAVGATSLRTRGVPEFTKSGGQEVRLRDLFGPKTEDLREILLTRDYWIRQETLPVRKPSSVRRSFFDSPETREREVKATRKWFTDTGREAFAAAQKSKSLSVENGEHYMTNEASNSLNVLLGHIDAPQVYTLKQQSYVNVAEPFKEKKNRRGWLFYLGSRIQDAQWAVNEEGDTQYLAIAVEQKSTIHPQPRLMEYPKAPAFTATKPFPASIQIWAFKADKNGRLDSSQQPRLQIVICTEWGAPKQFRWCPISTSDGPSPTDDEGDIHIGLLAGIWSDGRVRVLDVSFPRSNMHTADTHYLHIADAAFDVEFPQTVPSSLRWLSGTTLAVATAIGTLAVWTLSRSDTFNSKNNSSPKPWLYQYVSESYILTLSSGWPSQPHLVSITTADGFARMYDLRTPNADNATSIRGRTLCLTQDWHDYTQSFIAPDEHYMLKHSPVRRYYHNLYTMRAKSSVTRCAASTVQPAVLMGSADGRVDASNPIGRIANYKIIPWQQTWFAHEWRGPVDKLVLRAPGELAEVSEEGPTVGSYGQDDAATEEASAIPDSFLSQPLARITEGYKAYQPGIHHSVTSKHVLNPEVGKGITIYEEATAITALAWNPNLKFATWAVAGMGDGLLRVEDIGV
jgi:transcription factor C subunit 6